MTCPHCGPSTSSPDQGSPSLWAQYLGIQMKYQRVVGVEVWGVSGGGQKQKTLRMREAQGSGRKIVSGFGAGGQTGL